MSKRYPPGNKPDFNILPTSHKGGVVKGSGLRDDEVPLIASQGAPFVGPTATGPFPAPPEAQEVPPGPGATIDVEVPATGLAGADYSKIEKRVMAMMAVPKRVLGKKR